MPTTALSPRPMPERRLPVIAGALVYAAAYSVELGLSLTMYFSGEAKQ